MHMLVQNLPIYDQKGLLDTILRDLARRFFQSSTDAVAEKESLLRNAPAVAGVAALITGLVQNNSVLQSHLIHWLTSLHGEYAVLGIDIRRSVIVILASDQGTAQMFLPDHPTDAIQPDSKQFLTKAWNHLETSYKFNMIQYSNRSVSAPGECNVPLIPIHILAEPVLTYVPSTQQLLKPFYLPLAISTAKRTSQFNELQALALSSAWFLTGSLHLFLAYASWE